MENSISNNNLDYQSFLRDFSKTSEDLDALIKYVKVLNNPNEGENITTRTANVVREISLDNSTHSNQMAISSSWSWPTTIFVGVPAALFWGFSIFNYKENFNIFLWGLKDVVRKISENINDKNAPLIITATLFAANTYYVVHTDQKEKKKKNQFQIINKTIEIAVRTTIEKISKFINSKNTIDMKCLKIFQEKLLNLSNELSKYNSSTKNLELEKIKESIDKQIEEIESKESENNNNNDVDSESDWWNTDTDIPLPPTFIELDSKETIEFIPFNEDK
jgi:hypothetical protein